MDKINFNHVKINSWFGRLGNNIVQVTNALHIGLYYNINVIIPKHYFFNTMYIKINDDINMNINNLVNLTTENNFFSIPNDNIHRKCIEINYEETLRLLKKIILYPKTKTTLNDNDLIIHIRSGDIFKEGPHKSYISCPYSYYDQILKNNSFENIYLVSENKLNPIIDKLLKNYPNIIFKIRTLDEDISMVLESRNVVMDFGCFIPELLKVSNNIRKLYTSLNIYLNKYIKIEIIKIDLGDYRKIMYPWCNTKTQREYMLNN